MYSVTLKPYLYVYRMFNEHEKNFEDDSKMKTMTTYTLVTALAAAMTLPLATTSYAAGGGGGNTTVTCRKGKIWDKQKKKCVLIKKESNLSDDNLYEAARDLAYNLRYEEAIETLKLASNQNDPRILNYLGYSTRKLGDVEAGLKYYRTALKADPDYTLVREYMGEAFLQLGQVDKAQEQLAEIKSRCGTQCQEYAMLDQQINAYLKR